MTTQQLTELRQSLRDQLGSLDVLTRIGEICFVTDNLMTDQEFKLNRRRIAADLNAGRLHIADPETVAAQQADAGEFADTELLGTLKQMFSTALGKEINDIDADFFLDEGGTSLDYFSLIAGLQESYGIDFPNEAGKSPGSIRELYHYIEERL
jgi:acyl carrier protein